MNFIYQGEWVRADVWEDGVVVLTNREGKEVWIGSKEELLEVADESK